MLEFLDKVDNKTIIKIFSTKMGITGSGLDFENTFVNSEEQDIESSSIKIKAEDAVFANSQLVKTIGNSSHGWFVDNLENVHSHNNGSILCSLPLRVIEVCKDDDNNVVHCQKKVM